MTRRPYIEVDDRNPFGEDFDEQILRDAGVDSTYIAGYSDVRRDRELEVRAGNRPPSLKHRLHWVRAKSADGQHLDGRRVMTMQVNKKYEMLPYEDAIKLGYRVNENPAITKGEDGLAYLGDRVLMFCGAKVAASNLKKVQQDTQFALEAPQRRMQEAVERFNRDAKGAHAEAFSFLGDDPDEK